MNICQLFINVPVAAVAVLLLDIGTARAQVDDLEEAVGLTPESSTDHQPEPKRDSLLVQWNGKGRGYALLQGRATRTARDAEAVYSGPLAEFGVTGDLKPSEAWTLFGEGRITYDQDLERAKHRGILDQGGVRFRPVDQLLLVVGKERNRRAPGIIVSPSDFLHSDQNVPGLKEERGGVWQVRASLQLHSQSLDLIHLPVDAVRENGLPKDDSESLGYVFRYFARLSGGFDFGLDLGEINEELRAGAFIQTIAFEVLKLYAEFGNDQEVKAQSSLVGASYEGIADVVLRAELYQKDERWRVKSPVFRDERYLILSSSIAEIGDLLNVTESWIRSLDSSAFANVLHADWLVSSRHTVGASAVHLVADDMYQWQALADWKVSF